MLKLVKIVVLIFTLLITTQYPARANDYVSAENISTWCASEEVSEYALCTGFVLGVSKSVNIYGHSTNSNVSINVLTAAVHNQYLHGSYNPIEPGITVVLDTFKSLE